MAEDGKAKYAAEVWEFVKLFSRLGKTVYGLLLLLIGWVLLAKYARETLVSKEVVEGLWVPWVTTWWPLKLTWFHPSISLIVIVGVAIIVMWWLLYSRLISYILSLSRHFFKPIFFALIFFNVILFAVISIILLPLTISLTHTIRASRRHDFKTKWLAKRGKKIPEETTEQRLQAWTNQLDKWKKEKGGKIVDAILTNGAWEPTYFILTKIIASLSGKLLSRILSPCRIGLAPVTAQSYIEEFNASKLPLQVFAQAITRVRTNLSELALLGRIQLIELPVSAQIQQWSQASWFAWLFDTEVLLWGTFNESANQTISMNLFSRCTQQENKGELDKYGSNYQESFFPTEINIDFPALTFNQNDPYEVYLVLLVAEILALQTTEKRWKVGWRRKLDSLRIFDKTSLYSQKTIWEILLRVVPPALEQLGSKPLHETTSITGRCALVELAGQWIGSNLNVGYFSTFDELSERKGKSSTYELLKELAEVCVQLKPKDPIAHYRLGALCILLNSKELAVQYYKKAGELEKLSFQVHEIGARVAAGLIGENSFTKDGDLKLAVWATHAACAINTGSEYAIEEIRTMVDIELPEKLSYAILERPEPIAISVIKSMLPPKIQHDDTL